MRLVLLAAVLLVPTAAAASPSYEQAMQHYRTGLHELALARVVRDQPAKPDQPLWFEWEALRLALLAATRRTDEVIARVAALPPESPPALVRKAYGHAAWAHLSRGEGGAARRYLSQLIWRFGLDGEELKAARRFVVRSYLAARQPDEAYRAMLRFQQDYAPLPPEVAEEFVRGLLEQDRVTEAMTWLPSLPREGATALRLNLRANLLPVDAVIKSARGLLERSPDHAEALLVLLDVASLQPDPRLRIDTLERLANLPAEPPLLHGSELWAAYLREAEAQGNRLKLLKGDDRAWLDAAAQFDLIDPTTGHSLYAYLTEQARAGELRELARARLFAALASQSRDRAAASVLAASLAGRVLTEVELESLLDQAGADLPSPGQRGLWMAAGRYAEATRRPLLAADYYARVALSGDFHGTDTLGTLALEQASRILVRNGWDEDAAALRRAVAAAQAARQTALPAKKPKKK